PADQQQKRLVAAPALQLGERGDVRNLGARAKAVHRLGGIGEQPAALKMGDDAGNRGADRRVGLERQDAHRDSRASASATRKSSAVVTFTFSGPSSTTSTGKPACSHRLASSVGALSLPPRRAYACRSMSRGNPCGV